MAAMASLTSPLQCEALMHHGHESSSVGREKLGREDGWPAAASLGEQCDWPPSADWKGLEMPTERLGNGGVLLLPYVTFLGS